MALRFETLIERHHDEIYAYLWRLLGEDGRRDGAMGVEDLVQEIFLCAYRTFTTLRPHSNHRAWLYKIATNSAYKRLRQIKLQRERLSALKQSAGAFAPSTEGANGRKAMEARVRSLVDGLPAKQRSCVTMRYLQELDYPEIAAALDCSEASARANVYLAIRRLRAVLKEKK